MTAGGSDDGEGRRSARPAACRKKRRAASRSPIRSWRAADMARPHVLAERLAALEALFKDGQGGQDGNQTGRDRRLVAQLRRERARSGAGGSSYDLGRHAALLRALAALRRPNEKAPPEDTDGAS